MSRLPQSNPSAGGNAAGLSSGLTGWLSLAAAPTFAAMAFLTAGGAPPDMICAMHGASMVGGMVPMYLLMSLFHAGPWLRLLAGGEGSIRGRRAGGR
jgi:hypothetical protein